MTERISIEEIRDTAAFAERIAASPGPVVATHNGEDAFVAIRGDRYDELAAASAESKLLARMLLAEAERTAGATTDLLSDLDVLSAKYGMRS